MRMTYDKLTVALLSMLSTEAPDSTNSQIARCLLSHAGEAPDLSVKELATLAHVGVGSVSRFARDAGFADFAELRESFSDFARSFGRVAGDDSRSRAEALAEGVCQSVRQVGLSLDHDALSRLVGDLGTYGKVWTFGLLKGQAAALDLQVDLLMLGKWAETCTALPEQAEVIARARRDELVIVFSYSGAFFEYMDLSASMRRLDRPKIWMVAGARRPQPDYVSDQLTFRSDLGRMGHPYQLELVAGVIAQEYAAVIE